MIHFQFAPDFVFMHAAVAAAKIIDAAHGFAEFRLIIRVGDRICDSSDAGFFRQRAFVFGAQTRFLVLHFL